MSEWVQSIAAGPVAKAADAYQRGRDAGRQEGEAEGDRRGRGEGEQARPPGSTPVATR